MKILVEIIVFLFINSNLVLLKNDNEIFELTIKMLKLVSVKWRHRSRFATIIVLLTREENFSVIDSIKRKMASIVAAVVCYKFTRYLFIAHRNC